VGSKCFRIKIAESNRFWHVLIKHEMVAAVWRPVVELSRRRHLKFRERLEGRVMAGSVVAAGV
jgi:hypothetical protein